MSTMFPFNRNDRVKVTLPDGSRFDAIIGDQIGIGYYVHIGSERVWVEVSNIEPIIPYKEMVKEAINNTGSYDLRTLKDYIGRVYNVHHSLMKVRDTFREIEKEELARDHSELIRQAYNKTEKKDHETVSYILAKLCPIGVLVSTEEVRQCVEKINQERANNCHWGLGKEPDVMPVCEKCWHVAVPNNWYGFWCPTCNDYPVFKTQLPEEGDKKEDFFSEEEEEAFEYKPLPTNPFNTKQELLEWAITRIIQLNAHITPDKVTNDDIQTCIYWNYGLVISTGEISDIRQEIDNARTCENCNKPAISGEKHCQDCKKLIELTIEGQHFTAWHNI